MSLTPQMCLCPTLEAAEGYKTRIELLYREMLATELGSASLKQYPLDLFLTVIHGLDDTELLCLATQGGHHQHLSVQELNSGFVAFSYFQRHICGVNDI